LLLRNHPESFCVLILYMTADIATPVENLINGCLSGESKSQELLYRRFYSFAMGICVRYCSSREEAVEVLNDGFLKAFTNLKNFDATNQFEPWLKRILVNCSIDYYRKAKKHYHHDDVTAARSLETTTATPVGTLNHEELLKLVSGLPTSYRTVFNLYVIEGYNHKEIAKMMQITEGTSKSNLSRARETLRKHIRTEETHVLQMSQNEKKK
jgi:RNA polymerase sigma factor (sigma-70 family)